MYWKVWKASVGLKCVHTSRVDSLLNLSPLYIHVFRKVISVADISAVNCMVRWYLFDISMNGPTCISSLFVLHKENISSIFLFHTSGLLGLWLIISVSVHGRPLWEANSSLTAILRLFIWSLTDLICRTYRFFSVECGRSTYWFSSSFRLNEVVFVDFNQDFRLNVIFFVDFDRAFSVECGITRWIWSSFSVECDICCWIWLKYFSWILHHLAYHTRPAIHQD